MKKPDGNISPLEITSTISLKHLQYTVAEKLGRFPDAVQLRYKLDSDKVKAPATSIQTDDEFTLFIQRMRPLFVPQRLASGKISQKALRKVIVCFEDSADERSTESASKGKKKVCFQVSTWSHVPN